MSYSIQDLPKDDWPSLLKEIPNPPKRLRFAGSLAPVRNKLLCIVGSRKHTSYGREVCEELIAGLEGFPVTIVSGLAFGIDSIAHKAALKHKLHTIAVPGSGLDPDILYPRAHFKIAEEILATGGALLSEFSDTQGATDWTFPQRNRIMAGLCHATMVIEADMKSGTLITSKLATDYNRDVFTIPGQIFSHQSDGPHMLIRLGATLIRHSNDLIEALGFSPTSKEIVNYEPENDTEELLMKLLSQPKARDDLIRESKLASSVANATLAVLEIKGVIVESMGEIRLN